MPRGIKNFLYVSSGYLLRLTLFFGIVAIVILILFGNSRNLKTILSSNNAYTRFVPSIIEDNKRNPQTAKALPFDDPKLIDVFTFSFPPRDLKNATETVIDSTYAWLNGQKPQLTFNVDFTENKRTYAALLTKYAFDRFEKLPVCKVVPAEIDPLTATCIPDNIDVAGSRVSYEQQVFESSSLLEKTAFTEKDLPKNTSGQTIAEQYNFAPQVFKWLKLSPYIFAALIVVLSADFILLSPRRRKGVQTLAKMLLGTGISILAFPFVFRYVLPYFVKSLEFSYESVGTQKIFSEIINELNRNIDLLFILIGGVVAVIGLVLLIAERITRPNTKYYKIEKNAGLATANAAQTPPKNVKGTLSQETIPLQSSDSSKVKKVKKDTKYRTLNKKKELL